MPYGVETAAESLRHAVEALTSAQSRMAASMQRAGYWRDEYAGHGWEGLGGSCEAIRAAAETIHGQAAALVGQIEAQVKTAGTITDTTEPHAVVATLRPVEAELSTLGAHCLAGIGRCEDLAALTARNLEGGRPEWLVEQADHAGRGFRDAKREVDAATTAVAHAIQQAREAGSAAASMPTGAKLLSEAEDTDALSAAEAFRRNTVRKADDASDALGNVATFMREGFALRPTGAHVGEPPPLAVSEAEHAATPDIFTGVAVLAGIIGELARSMRRSHRRKDQHGHA